KLRANKSFNLFELKILLDENLDWRLCRDLPGHQVESVPLIGVGRPQERDPAGTGRETVWRVADHGQQHALPAESGELSDSGIALEAPSNRLADTRPLMPQVLAL